MLLSIELNELNFDYLKKYIEIGKLTHFAKLFNDFTIDVTTSEAEYKNQEPWIQWVTAHTGKSFHEHGIFRLGDITTNPVVQIWEHLESKGVSVGAVSPMNAANRLRTPKYFVPDPWTQTKASGSWLLQKLHASVSQAVSDNATSKITPGSALYILLGAARYASPSNYLRYLKLATGSRRKKWNKALFLDLLLADIFMNLQVRHKAEFATLFLNAGAHVQHHYLFSSAFSVSPHRNPSWYVEDSIDPVYEVYELYDHILGRIVKAFPAARMLLITGLHQTAYPKISYYWRLKSHDAFLHSLGLKFQSVVPLMSRDFIVKCKNPEEAASIAAELSSIRSADGTGIFSCDQRIDDVFVELVYDQDIQPGFEFIHRNHVHSTLPDNVAFVAIKNGEHTGDGYYLDTSRQKATKKERKFPLKNVYGMIAEEFSA